MKNLSIEKKKILVNLFKKINVVQFGEFKLKDGSKSSVYIDLRILPNYPQTFQKATEIATNFLLENNIDFDGIIAPPIAGIPLGVAIAIKLNKSFYLARLEAKIHGTGKLIEGNISGKKILLVDDVITSGGSKIPLIDAIKKNKGRVTDLFVYVNRMTSKENIIALEEKHGFKTHSLLIMSDLNIK